MRNAAGLFNALSGAPFKTMPKKMQKKPKHKPMTVDISKYKTPYIHPCDTPLSLSITFPIKKENPTFAVKKFSHHDNKFPLFYHISLQSMV